MANEVKVVVGADTKQAESAMKRFSDNTRKAGLALSAMGAGGVLAIKGFTSAALEQEQATTLFLNSARNAGAEMEGLREKVERATSALQNKTNFGDEEQRRVLAKMIPVLGSTERAMAALPVIMDAAATTGRGLREQSETLTKALAGTVHQAESLGIKYDKNATFAERLAQTQSLVSGAAESTADPFIQLGNAMGDVSEKIGAALLPLVVPLLDGLKGFATTLQNLNPNVLKWGAGILFASTALGVLGGPLLLIISAIPRLIKGLHLATIAQKLFNLAIKANPAGIIFSMVIGGLVVFAGLWATNMKGVRDITKKVFDSIGGFLEFIVNKIIDGVNFIARQISRIPGITIPEIEKVQFSIGDMVSNALGSVGDFVAGAGDKFKEFMFKGTDAAEEVGITMADALDFSGVDVIPPDFKAVTDGAEKAGKAASETIGALIASTTQKATTILNIHELELKKMVEAGIAAGASYEEAWKNAANRIDGMVKNKINEAMDDIALTAEQKADRAEMAAQRMARAWRKAASDIGGELGRGSTLVGPGAMSGLMAATKGHLGDREAMARIVTAHFASVNQQMTDVAAGYETKQAGGFIGGGEGQGQLIMAHGGELVLNRAQQASLGTTFNITVNGGGGDPNELARAIAEEVNAVLGEHAIRNEQTRSR